MTRSSPISLLSTLVVPLVLLTASTALPDDWPMWRHDVGRTAATDQSLSGSLHLQWVRSMPPLRPAYRNHRLQFDAGYEPIVVGTMLFVGSSHNDSIVAMDTRTGAERWRFYADGPIRFAPVAWDSKVYFGSDDGHLYCLDATTGAIVWKFRAVPSDRKLLGNGRLISVWPVRGGPVVQDGTVYFAAGVWPSEGVFIYALDAADGRVVWLNDRTGCLYGQHPHGAEAFGGLTPQGYLLVVDDQLIVPCGSALPARLDRKTGKLISFALPKKPRYPGGWFSAEDRARRRGLLPPGSDTVVLDAEVNSDRHEDHQYQGPGQKGIRTTVYIGSKELKFSDKIDGVTGEIHSMLAADDRLFVVTREGCLYCFGAEQITPKSYRMPVAESPAPSVPELKGTESVLRSTHSRYGYCLVWGVGNRALIDTLIQKTRFKVIGVGRDLEKIRRLRRALDRVGSYGERVSLLVGLPHQQQFPAYMATLVLVSNLDAIGGKLSEEAVRALFRVLRPYGGEAHLALSDEQTERLRRIVQDASLENARVTRVDGVTVLTRVGSLPGSCNYTGGWSSPDSRVKAPLGVLWFDDSVGNFKRAPQPWFVDGVMISYDKLWRGYPQRARPPYALARPVYSDVYTGRRLSADEVARIQGDLPKRDLKEAQPNQHHPPTQKDAWNPEPPVVGERVNPLTGVREPRAIVKSYGCDGGNDYGLLFTVRSGTAAFYDKRNESGTIHISGPRSGCTNSIIPANGLLNVPYFYQGCTCSYPLPVGLALAPMPPDFEQWTVWGASKPGPIQRIGINLGAPGDRVTGKGTLWLDSPSVGGPSPDVPVDIQPASAEAYYHHSLWITGGTGWPWVCASGIEGITSLTVAGLKKTRYTVRLFFAEPDVVRQGDRVFDIQIQGKQVVRSMDVVRQAGGRMRGLVKTVPDIGSDGSIEVRLVSHRGRPILSGVELLANGLEADPLHASQ